MAGSRRKKTVTNHEIHNITIHRDGGRRQMLKCHFDGQTLHKFSPTWTISGDFFYSPPHLHRFSISTFPFCLLSHRFFISLLLFYKHTARFCLANPTESRPPILRTLGFMRMESGKSVGFFCLSVESDSQRWSQLRVSDFGYTKTANARRCFEVRPHH